MSELTERDEAIEASRKPQHVVIRARSEFADRLQTVTGVIEAYLLVRDAPPVVCVNLDPLPENRSHKWTPVGAEFCADVESALRRFLVLRHDRIALRRAWESLLERDDYSRVSADEKTLIMSLAPAMERIGLQPHLYFRHVRRKSPW